MKTTYQFFVIYAKVQYLNGMTPMQEHIWQAYIDGLVKNDNKYTIAYQTNDYDKAYMAYNRTKIIDKIVNVDSKRFVDTQIYYFIQCKYIDNKFESYKIEYCKYPKQTKYKDNYAYG